MHTTSLRFGTRTVVIVSLLAPPAASLGFGAVPVAAPVPAAHREPLQK